MVIFLSYRLYDEYKRTLSKTLVKQKEKLEDQGKRNEHNTVNVIRRELGVTDERHVLNALKIFERLDPIEFHHES